MKIISPQVMPPAMMMPDPKKLQDKNPTEIFSLPL
jgi:hypothetical protein